MAINVARVLTISALVVGLPAACFGGILMYGRALADVEVSEGTLVTPEESRRRAEEFQRRFRAMSAAEHLAEARVELDRGYNREARSGGNLNGAAMHLSAIEADAGAYAEVRPLLDEIERRRARALDLGAVALRDLLRQHANDGDEVKAQTRRAVGCALDHFSPQGMGCVHVAAPDETTLRFDNSACTQAMIDRVVPPDQRAAMRTLGFRQIRCANGAASVDL